MAMISIYPPPNSKHSKMGGVASYTHNLVNSMPKNELDITVFANILPDIELDYIENNIKIKRCWNKGILYPFQIFYNILSSKMDIIHIQHEYFLYGNGISAAMFPMLQFLLKILNKKIIVTIHGIIPLSKLNDEFIEQNKLKGKKIILRTELYWLTKLIIKLSDNIIVHEDKLKEILQREYVCDSSKINVVYHGVEDRRDLIENDKAKQILGYQDKKIVLFFGYLTGYKGIELLIDAFNYIDNKDIILIIAGGEHPRLKEDENYKGYIKGLKDKAAKTGNNIIFTGFIPEENIGTYFSAADLVVCPYTIFMSSSGPLSLSLTYLRPFIVSEQLKDLIGDELTFRNDPKDLAKKIDTIIGINNSLKESSLNLCTLLREKRLWNSVSKQTCQIYNSI